MSEYYAVQRSDEYLAHYGVKGMKWGVRKAIADGNGRRLDRHYRKALNKMKKLNTKANIQRSKQEYKGRMSDAASIGVPGVAAGALGAGWRALEKAKNVKGIAYGVGPGLLPFVHTSGSVMALGGLAAGAGGYQLAKGLAAKHRTTKKGHAKAVQKQQKFRKAMGEAFKGTKYAKLPGANKINKPYGYIPPSQQWREGARTAALSTVAGPIAANMRASKKIANEVPGNKPRQGKRRKRT